MTVDHDRLIIQQFIERPIRKLVGNESPAIVRPSCRTEVDLIVGHHYPTLDVTIVIEDEKTVWGSRTHTESQIVASRRQAGYRFARRNGILVVETSALEGLSVSEEPSYVNGTTNDSASVDW